MKDPIDLLDAGKHNKALAVLQRRLDRNPKDGAALATLPYAHLCLGRLGEALQEFIQLNEKEKINPGCPHPAYQLQVGVVQWLLGMYEEAVRTVRYSVDGILDGTIKYADATGGTPQGLLLWYMAVSMRDDGTRDHALAYLRTVTSRWRIADTPGIAEFAIGKLSKHELLRSVFSTRFMWLIRLQANIKNNKKYMLSRIWFYFGVQARADGDEAECQRCMLECSRLEYSGSHLEWHLAKAEVAGNRTSE